VVRDGDATFVVRIGDDLPLHSVVRSQEVATCIAAHACGLAPEIVHHEPGALVMRHIDARTLTAQDVRHPDMLARIVEVVQRCHDNMAHHLRGATLMFWPFQICRDYLRTARQGDCRLGGRLQELADINASLEHQLGPINPAFCHNDLLPANFLDDGDRLWLLDWEYAGWNSPMFDLANLASNAGMDTAQQHGLIETYLQRAAQPADITTFRVATCASLLRESLWSIVQEQHSPLDFDFVGYTDDYRGRLEVARQELEAAR
jgi:thiamine kinase-like enzyme